MTIVLYKDNLNTGRGADRQVSVLAGGLAQRGYDVTVISGTARDVFAFPVDASVKTLCVQRAEVRDAVLRFDLCLAAGSNEMLDLTADGMRPSPIRTVMMLLTSPKGLFKRKRFIRNRRIRRALNFADAAVLLSEAYRRDFYRVAPCPRLYVIGEWPELVPPSVEVGTLPRPKVIVYPAAFNRLKNQEMLIRAFALAADRMPGWKLYLYGSLTTAYAHRCRRLAEQLGVADRVRFPGFTDDLPAMYASASVLAFPSQLEGFPLTMIEAGLYGLPTVATESLQGVRDMVRSGETGLITEGNPRAFAEALMWLAKDRPMLEKLSNGARTRVREDFSRGHILDCWEALIREQTSCQAEVPSELRPGYSFECQIAVGVVLSLLLIVGVAFLPISPVGKDFIWGVIGLSAGVVSALWTWWWPRVPARVPIFLMLHSVSDAVVDPECANNTLRPSELEALIRNLQAAGYTFKTASEAAETAGRRTVVLSFDDGYADNYCYLFPILKKYGVKATCYITNRGETDSAFLTPNQVREMDASGLVEFGGHTAHHIKLDTVPFETAKTEIDDNVAWLTKVLGKAPTSFAYPCGGYTDDVIDEVRSVGYRTAVTMHKKMRPVSDNPLLIHRQIIPRDKTPWQAYALATRGKYKL